MRQEECLRINLSVYTLPKKRLMHFHFENGINNPIPRLSDLQSCKDQNPITFDDHQSSDCVKKN